MRSGDGSHLAPYAAASQTANWKSFGFKTRFAGGWDATQTGFPGQRTNGLDCESVGVDPRFSGGSRVRVAVCANLNLRPACGFKHERRRVFQRCQGHAALAHGLSDARRDVLAYGAIERSVSNGIELNGIVPAYRPAEWNQIRQCYLEFRYAITFAMSVADNCGQEIFFSFMRCAIAGPCFQITATIRTAE